MDDHSIHMVKPESWPDVVVDLKKSKSKHSDVEKHWIDFSLKLNSGLLFVQSVAYKRVQSSSSEHYCTMNNL
eukprot:gene16049-18114_t